MSPPTTMHGHIFTPQPSAGSGHQVVAQQRWAPGNGSVLVSASHLPPGSGPAISERDQRLAKRHEERRKRSSAITDPQKTSMEYKAFHLSDQDRKSLEFEQAGNNMVHDPQMTPQYNGTVQGSKENAEGTPCGHRRSSALLAAETGESSGLRAALDRKAIDKTRREAMYEEKRLRYLERVKRENASKSSNIKVQEQGVEGTTSSTASLTSASDRQEEICAPQNRTGSEQNMRRLEMDHYLNQAGNNPSELVGRVIHAQDNGGGNGYNGRNQPEEQVSKTSFRSMSKQATKQHRSACDNMEYTGRLRKQMPEDSVATLPSFSKDVHNPVPEYIGGSLPILPLPDIMEDRIGSERGSTGVAYVAGDPERKVISNSKAKYAQQLREQIVANEKARRAVDSEKVESGATTSAIPGTSGEGDVVDRTVRVGSERGSTGVAYVAGDPERKAISNSKAKYAQQLREQILANEKARRAVDSEKVESDATASAIPGTSGEGDVVDRTVRAREEYAQQLREQIASKIADKHAEGQKDYVDPTASDGLAWLESATEGRERQRRILKAEYAEQLRAQIAERAGGQRRLKFDSHSLDEEISGGLRLSRNWGKRASDAVAHMDNEVRPSHIPSDESPAFERQKRLENQQKYAEALRRDMAAPKIDSLGRPIEDITRPTKTHRENVKSNDDRLSAHHLVTELSHQQRQPHHPTWYQYSNRTSEHSPHQWQIEGGQQSHCRWRSEDGPTLRAELGDPRRDAQARRRAGPFRYKDSLDGDDRTGGLNRAKGQEGIEYSTGRDIHLQLAEVKRAHKEVDPRVSEEQNVLPQRRSRANSAREYGHGDSDWRKRAEVKIESRNITMGESRYQRWQAPQHMRQIEEDPIITRPGIDVDCGNHKLPQDMLPSTAHQEAYGCSRNWGLGENSLSGEKYQSHALQNGAPTRRAWNMHNPMDLEEVARVKAKKDAYRRELEAQIAEQKQKNGKHESKDTEVMLLEEAMAKRNKRNEKAPGYEIGPLGVAVMKDSFRSRTLDERGVPPSEVRSTTPSSPSHKFRSKETSGLPKGKRDDDGKAVVPIRGSGSKEPLGLKGNEMEKERSRMQEKALKNQAKDNNARREKEYALLQEEEARILKESKQLQDRHAEEERALMKKAEESERFIKEAEAKRALMAHKEAEAARIQQLEKEEDIRVERERKELEKKYAEERMAETPLGFVESSPALQARDSEATHNSRKNPVSPARLRTLQEEKAVSAVHSSPEGHATRTRNCSYDRSTVDPNPNPKTPPDGSSGNDHAVTLENLQNELWKKRQLTELLRREVEEQEAEKRKLLEASRCAKEYEATVQRETSKGLSSQRCERKNRKDRAGLWRVPPPSLLDSDVNYHEAPSTPGNSGDEKNEDRQWVEMGSNLPVIVRKSEMDDTEEDRRLLAGLRRIGAYRNAHGESLSVGNKPGESTFREQAPVDRSWKSHNTTNRGVEGNESSSNDQLRRYNGLPADGIRAESRFVFPDGSIRRALSNDRNNGEGIPDNGPGRNPDVPMTLVGTSRFDSAADLSTALVASYVDNGRSRHKNSLRHSRNDKMRGHQGEDYRTPPESRSPPHPYVPFLNLPALEGKKGCWSRHRHNQELRRKESHTSYDKQVSLLPSKLEAISRQRKILATPETGYRRFPRTMTGTAPSSSSRTSYNGNSEDARGKKGRKLRGLDHSDDGYSTHDDWVSNTSDSTDVEEGYALSNGGKQPRKVLERTNSTADDSIGAESRKWKRC